MPQSREGVELSESTLGDWVGAVHHLLRPLLDALQRHVFAAEKLQADDTPIDVLMPGSGKTRQARLWVYVRDDRPSGATTAPAVWFRSHACALPASFSDRCLQCRHRSVGKIRYAMTVTFARLSTKWGQFTRGFFHEWRRGVTCQCTSRVGFEGPGLQARQRPAECGRIPPHFLQKL